MINKYDVIVVGGGPAGMMAAGTAASNGKSVLLIEKNEFLGKKLRITGKGRCNITNVSDETTLLENIPRNSKFMYSSFNNFTNYDVISFFNEHGVETVVERGGRVFPKSQKAISVVNAMIDFVKNNDVNVICEKVIDIFVENNAVKSVKTNKDIYSCDSVIIATGGLSYPLTGSTGDGYKLAKKLGHSIVDTAPSLVPIETENKWCIALQGLSLKNVKITLFKEQKEIYTDFGEMIFTHFGISGPIILSSSAHITDNSKYYINLDLKPALTNEVLDKRLIRDFEKYSNKDFINSLDELLPKKLIPIIVSLSKIEPHKKVNEITKQEREVLVSLLKNLKIDIKKLRPIEEAIVTRGGVSVKEINPSTMESKLISGLYFCGEVIDVDAYTGGYNLQIAFSTGYKAGQNA